MYFLDGLAQSADPSRMSPNPDNTKLLAVARILGDGTGQDASVHRAPEHYLFAERFGRPGEGNDKGKVAGWIGGLRAAELYCFRLRALPCAELNVGSAEAVPGAAGVHARGHD